MTARLDTLQRMSVGFEKPVTIYWNQNQVPFIDAQTDRDAAYALGLVHAHLRLGQMEFGKRVASGRISEMVGPFATDLDAALRALDLNKAAPQVIANMPEETRTWMQAFVKGVNDYKNQMPERPHEFITMNMTDEPWTMQDSLLLGRLGGLDVNWFSLIRLLPKRDTEEWPAIWTRLARQNEAAVPSFTVPQRRTDNAPDHDEEKLALLVDMLSIFAKSGSNSFAVDASRSASGAPIIANDPHLGFTIPSIWFVGGMKSPSYHVVGMMAPGLPIFAFGRNEHIAWGGTNMRQEASDFVDVSAQTDALENETHIIKRRLIWDTSSENRIHPVYGPVLSDTDILPFPEGRDIALRWTGHLASDEITAMLGVSKAQNWREMRRAVERFSVPGQSFVFAGTDGTIGQILGTWIPQRSGNFPSDLFVTPEQSDAAWRNILTAKDLPSIVNPPNGIIASGNNKPYTGADPRIGWSFSPGDRVARIDGYLQTKPQWSADDMGVLQRDTYSVSHVILRDALIETAQGLSLSDEAQSLLDRFARWDGHFKAESQTAYLFNLWAMDSAKRLYPNERLKDAWEINGYITRFMAEDLPKRPDIIRESLEYGASYANDDTVWGDVHRLRIGHVFVNIPVLGNRYMLDEIGVGGHSTTLFKTAGSIAPDAHSVRFGSHARHVSDLADINDNRFIVFGGQDGWVNSKNFADQVPLWRDGRYITVPYTLDQVRQRFSHRTVFQGR